MKSRKVSTLMLYDKDGKRLWVVHNIGGFGVENDRTAQKCFIEVEEVSHQWTV